MNTKDSTENGKGEKKKRNQDDESAMKFAVPHLLRRARFGCGKLRRGRVLPSNLVSCRHPWNLQTMIEQNIYSLVRSIHDNGMSRGGCLDYTRAWDGTALHSLH
jgi:hypothetical protein